MSEAPAAIPIASLPIAMVCSGCGTSVRDDEPFPFRCPNAGGADDIDHVLTRMLDLDAMAWPDDDDPNPFVRYRTLLRSWHLARAGGMSDDDYVALVRRIDSAVAGVDGRGFRVTPFAPAPGLAHRIGQGTVWVKDETGNVSGSHKARHLMGLMLHLEVAERVGLVGRGGHGPYRLAIASCGNAALAAGVVAAAAERTLEVFVPPWADPSVVERLRALGAELTVCRRDPGTTVDPTYRALQRAVAGGAIPFTCQGPSNGLTIEGGHTLAWEMVSWLATAGQAVDRLFIQVGGGALASSVVQGFREAVDLGANVRVPRFHAVQTAGGYPVRRAYDRLADRISDRLREEGIVESVPGGDAERAGLIGIRASDAPVQEELERAAAHRSEYMWPWETEPKSIAHGILDDETYDWGAVVRGMVETGGWPVVVDEPTLTQANDIARESTDIDADHTGTSGLAGLLALRQGETVGPGERIAVLFTGSRRTE